MEKPPFLLLAYIADTGIAQMRDSDAIKEKGCKYITQSEMGTAEDGRNGY